MAEYPADAEFFPGIGGVCRVWGGSVEPGHLAGAVAGLAVALATPVATGDWAVDAGGVGHGGPELVAEPAAGLTSLVVQLVQNPATVPGDLGEVFPLGIGWGSHRGGNADGDGGGAGPTATGGANVLGAPEHHRQEGNLGFGRNQGCSQFGFRDPAIGGAGAG